MMQIRMISMGMPKDWLKSKDSFGNRLVKPVLQLATLFWHRTYLKKHFQQGAVQRYDYRARSKSTKYNKRKAARRGFPDAKLPLVMSGDLRREVTRTVRISGTNKKARATMSAPRYVHMYSKGGDRPFIAGEMTTIVNEEERALGKLVKDTMTEKMNNDKTRSVRRFG